MKMVVTVCSPPLLQITLMTQDQVTDADMDEIKASNGLLPNGLPVDAEGADDAEDPHEVVRPVSVRQICTFLCSRVPHVCDCRWST